MRGFKVIIKDFDTNEELAIRVNDDCNFLPVQRMKDRITIKGNTYIVLDIKYDIDDTDIWLQLIKVRKKE